MPKSFAVKQLPTIAEITANIETHVNSLPPMPSAEQEPGTEDSFGLSEILYDLSSHNTLGTVPIFQGQGKKHHRLPWWPLLSIITFPNGH